MSATIINYSKAKSADEAFALASEGITQEYIAKYNVKADIDYNSEKKQIQANGKGFKLTVNFQNSQALLDVELSFLLKPLKAKITESVEKKLARIL